MEPKIAQFINKGMQQDYSISKASNEFAFKNHNIRITTRGENSLLTVTNEKSNKELLLEFGGIRCYYDDSPFVDAYYKIEFENPEYFVTLSLECKVLVKTLGGEFSVQNRTINFDVPEEEHTEIILADYIENYITKIRIIDIYKIHIIEEYGDTPSMVLSAFKKENNVIFFTEKNIIKGITLGYCTTNNETILFTKTPTKDYIYSVDFDSGFYKTLYSGNLNFSLDHAIETLYNYESVKVEKVYWVDGINPPRVINIKGEIQKSNDFQFDFNPVANTDIIVEVAKKYDGNGLFPSGIIQYVITYYNNYMQESSPVYISPIQYLTNANKGASAEDKVSCSFVVKCSNLDTRWDNIVLYSLQRSSLNSTVLGYKVGEYSLKNLAEDSEIVFIDTNSNNETIDATRFLFDTDDFIPSTLASKAEKLFFGDLQESNKEDLTFVLKDNKNVDIKFGTRTIEYPNYGGIYDYKFQLDKGENDIKTFKGGEKYRIALQLQDNKGIWSSPIYLKDLKNDIYPKRQNNTLKLSCINTTIPYNTLIEKIPNFEKYSRARLLMAEPTVADRSVLAQGILSPTIYNMLEASSGTCHNINSWIQRFTSIDKHLTNVSHKAIKNGDLENPFYLETPIEKDDEGKLNFLNIDCISSYKELSEEEGTNIATVNLKSLKCIIQIKGNYNKGSAKEKSNIAFRFKKAEFDTYDEYGTLLGTIDVDLNNVGIQPYHDLDNPSIQCGAIYGATSERRNYKKMKGDLAAMFNSINHYIQTAKFYNEDLIEWVSTESIHNKPDSLYNLLQKAVGKDIKILNIKSDDFIFKDYMLPWDADGLYKMFYDNYSNERDFSTTVNINEFYQGEAPSEVQKTRTSYSNNYFLDAHKVSIFSPDLSNVSSDTIRFRIVGCAPLRHNISSYNVTVDNPNGVMTSLNLNLNKTAKYLRSHYLYNVEDFLTSSENNESITGNVLLTLWQKGGGFSNNKETNILKRKIVGNLWYCDTDYYADGGKTKILWDKETSVSYKNVLESTTSFRNKLYKKDYENLLLPYHKGFEHIIKKDSSVYDTLEQLEKEIPESYRDEVYNGCLVKYSSENHGIIELPKDIILPGFNPEVSIEVPIRVSTGEYLTSAKEERFIPFPLHMKVDSIPNRGDESSDIFIDISGGDEGKNIRIPNDSRCIVVFWTEDELDQYITNHVIEDEEFKQEIKNVLNNNNVIQHAYGGPAYRATQFLRSIIYKTDASGNTIQRTAIYRNVAGDLASNLVYDGYFKLYDGVLSPSEFVNKYVDVAVFPVRSNEFPLDHLGIKSNSHADHCKASIVENLPTFIYNASYSIASEESEKFQYAIGNKFWNTTPCVWIGEIYKDNGDAYGGNSDLSIANTNYIVCSDTFDIETESDLKLKGTIGDTYFQRWDCLRTYPTTEEDTNSIVDVVSVMIESRTNLDGRYDNNRGRLDVHMNRPTNMNLYNNVYSQTNNFFSYNSVDIRTINNSLSNCYTWSLSKTNNELIDNWTKGLMVNVNNVDGSKGKITKLQLWKDYLLLFQERGIARIHYNDKTAINTVEGVPVEIANSQNVLGHNYLSEVVGCHNKWSIASTEAGIYFVDSINKSINLFNGETINLTHTKSFKDWGANNINFTIWSPNNSDGYKASFDFKNRDYYLTNYNNCLCFSEELQSFSSFYDYTESPMMFNYKDKFIGIQSKENTTIPWEQFAGNDFCNFYGEQKEYSIEFNINPNPLNDKLFTNLEYRAYVDNSDDTFDKLEVSNEYQYGESNPNIGRHKYPNAERKFRIWRLDIPRDSNSRKGLDRIRNPWMKLKLIKTNNVNNKMNFHDLLVKYYE